jgi:PhnB protein
MKESDRYVSVSESPSTDLIDCTESGVLAMQLANYLFFTTTCEQALAFYTQCGLGKVTQMMRYGSDSMPAPTPEMRGKIMHARFEGAGVLFYASDNHDAEPMRGSAHLLMMDGRERTDRLFAQLADGGTITTPLGMQPWGDYYGKVTDQFGVQWMLNCPIRSQSLPA